MPIHRHLTRRDAVLLLLGATIMHVFSVIFTPNPSTENSFVINTHVHDHLHDLKLAAPDLDPLPPPPDPLTGTETEKEKMGAGNGMQEDKDVDVEVDINVAPGKHRINGIGSKHTGSEAISKQLPSSSSHLPNVIQTQSDLARAPSLPHTEIIHHAPGYTLFRNLYMSNGALIIVTPDTPASQANRDREGDDYPYTRRDEFPEIRMMASVPIFAEASEENIRAREPTRSVMRFVSPEEAERLWVRSRSVSEGEEENQKHVYVVEGNTVLLNDPSQFLRHYYHFVAELWFGVQAFWHGAFSTPIAATIPDPAMSSNPQDRGDGTGSGWEQEHNHNAYPVDSTSKHPSTFDLSHPENRVISDLRGYVNQETLNDIQAGPRPDPTPAITRAIFMHSNADGWRDDPGFNAYFLRAALPSLTVEHMEDWEDRVRATGQGDRAYLFPLVLLIDRSAAFRTPMTGSHTQRTAASAWEYMRGVGRLRGERVGAWWEGVRGSVVRFAGGKRAGELGSGTGIQPATATKGDLATAMPLPSKLVITYISRQAGKRRKLTDESHEGLVGALRELVERKNRERVQRIGRSGALAEEEDNREWELNIMEAEKMTKDEQVRAVSRTSILLGVHGNGLTHLVFMPPTRISSVIEIFYPGGFAHDYHWTSRALGMRHYAVWNDTSFTHPNEPRVDYPEGFQENYIPVHGPSVAELIERIAQGK